MFLPSIKGRFPVGVTTFVTPVRPSRPVGSLKFQKSSLKRAESDHALFLEEVAFTAYYPAELITSTRKGIPWFARPLRDSLKGFSSFLGLPTWLLWPIVYLFGALVKMPVYPNAPLLDPSKASHIEKQQWPLVIFSHGLGGGRNVYSQYCSKLAAEGMVVLAVEHRDGTGIMVAPRKWTEEGKSEHRPIFYVREADIQFDDSENRIITMRGQQLEFRHQEIYLTYTMFRRFLQDDSTLEYDTIDGSSYAKHSWTTPESTGKSKVRTEDNVILSGHSFGGCTMLSLLSTEPPEGYEPIPVGKTVILDPWLEPLPTPGPILLPRHFPSKVEASSEDANPSSDAFKTSETLVRDATNLAHPEIVVINSEVFTVWRDHFARLKELVAKWEHRGRLLTLVGSEHASFSDFTVLPLIRKKHAESTLDLIIKMALAFLDNKLDTTLKTIPTVEGEIKVIGKKKDGKPKRKITGNIGDIVVHY